MAALAEKKKQKKGKQIDLDQQPILIQAPGAGALVPVGNQMVDAVPAQPIAAQMDNFGALEDPAIQAAGTDAQVAPVSMADESGAALSGRTGGGAASGALIAHADFPKPIIQEEEGGGGFDALKAISGLAQAAGRGGASGGGSGDGLMGKLKSLFHGDTVAPGVGGPRAPGQVAMPKPVQVGALPDIGLSSSDPNRTVQPANISGATTGGDMTKLGQAPNVPQDPGFLDKLRSNPLAMALLLGGLQTMSSASRPGATALGSIGQGGIAGLQGAFGMEDARMQRERDDRRLEISDAREASMDELRAKQGAFYDARTTAEPVRAGAIADTAKARSRTAEAQMVRSEAYAKNGGKSAGSAASVFQQKQQAWLAVPGHENDLQGALDYAAGHKNMSGADKYLAARRLATSQLNGMVVSPDDPDGFLDGTTADILRSMDANDAPPAAAPSKPQAKPQGGALTTGAPQPRGNPSGARTQPNQGALMDQARAAIKRGADPAAVKARLQKMGGNPGAL